MYNKTTWTSTTTITAEALNHLETQFDTFMTDYGTHNHDTVYYTKSQADSRYFWSGHMGLGSGSDADTLDGYHLSDILSDVLPVGAICIWSGVSPPSGWVICDGSSGTPDLREKFVMGGTLADIGQTGGSSSITTMGGTVTTSGTTLTTDDIPYHYHKIRDYYATGGVYQYSGSTGVSVTSYSDLSRTTNTTGGGSAHDHGSFSVTFNSFSNIPPYYSLYYIKKVS